MAEKQMKSKLPVHGARVYHVRLVVGPLLLGDVNRAR